MSELITVIYPDGARTVFTGAIEMAGDVAWIFPVPGTLVHKPGPWHRRLAYWLKCRCWRLTTKWKIGDENG